MSNAVVTVKGFQYVDDSESSVELKTLGRYERKNGKEYIIYEETDENKATTKTMIKVTDSIVTMQRTGAIDNTLVIEKGKRHGSFYTIPEGSLFLEVYGEKVDNRLDEKGGKLTLQYNMSLNSTPVGRNKIEITVKEV